MIVVMFSGGITSFEVLRRVQASGQPFRALFADVKMEDDDTERFTAAVERVLGVTIERTADGRNPWEVFRAKRFIAKHGKTICSHTLKRKRCVDWMKANEPNGVVAIGLDWSEPLRVERNRAAWKRSGFDTVFPLAEAPLQFKAEHMETAAKMGIDPPRMYKLGFEHNNCGGGCVLGGQAQWAHLWRTLPERYAWHEEQERLTRQHIGKNVSVLRDRRGGKTVPMTLEAFRIRLENGGTPMDSAWSCTCMGA